ncbi:putative rRNA maturation factor [Abditibacterium utsteinense]|uniref:Endoribonuclease YbeY n=1 Tax=Abditibacterium utsteinense TaxID=1960156 RepID=A0A2S8STF6_9BACT|nr:rRNA maturation RNase YbeY [Abditibacterium utsteinense]PQV64066.1 putative rRNA maturation factor [Abditibacterium utsteinense]
MAPPRTLALKKRFPTIEGESAAPLEFTIDFSFVDDAKIQQLNRDYRSKDKPTDVLSFSLFESDDEFVFPIFGEEIALGDIVISTQTAARQAIEQGHAIEREIAFLAVHGALHLLGYDHGKDGERRSMFSRQDAIFEAIFSA